MSSKEHYLDKKQIIMVAVLIMGAAISVLNQTSITPMLPIIIQEMDVTSSTAQWLVSGFSLVTAVIIPVSAYLMKRFSTRAVYFVSMGLFIVGSALCCIAPNFAILMTGRIMQAACAGVLMPLATSIMLLVFPPERRGSAMGLYSLITSLMPAVGPAVAGGLTDTVGWRLVYIIMLVIALAITVFAIATLRNYGRAERVALDVPSVILSALGLVALLTGISLVGDGGFTLFSGGLMLAGIVIIALFVFRQTRLDQPVLNMAVFKYRRFVIGLSIVVVVMIIVGAPAATIPLIVQQGLGESPTITGLLSLPASLVGAATALTAGRLFDRIGGRPLALVGSSILVIAYLGAMCMVEEYGVLWMAAFMILTNLGMMFVTTPLNTWALGFLPDELIPHGNAMSNTLRQVGMSISISFFVVLMAVVANTQGGMANPQAVILGGRATFLCEGILALIVLAAIAIFVKQGQEAQIDAAQPKASSEALARDFMRIDTPFLTDKATLREAMALFNREGTTDSPIIDEKGRVVAFLSSGDIMAQLVERQVIAPDLTGWSMLDTNETFRTRLTDLIDRNVMGVATQNVVTVRADDSLDDVCRLLSKRQFKKVPVVEDGRLVGTINRDDVVHHIMDILAKAKI
ncbi:DHA2 family efflux MFS transporter permease subunit [Anaerotardibacter muris]|uniref:DHA2 family efflux MFS transporter permease subunit n=1 Tax=Anaerotardibacter muris TaxID=2941505 RepID=UPI002041B1E5|nr:DHA2 family efflux MFS transporter permease subunit [Anaerotardibacter muris]